MVPDHGVRQRFQKLYPQVTYQIYIGNADHTKERIEGGTLTIPPEPTTPAHRSWPSARLWPLIPGYVT